MSSSDESENEKFNKKTKMRTATDVVSRLLWDESLPESDFVVGYLDRFKGIVEKPFASLDWSDPSTVDNNTLALPKHRIQYFKYKGKKVWDKKSRLDLVFNSTGDYKSIHDFMLEVDKREQYFFHEDEGSYSEDEDEDQTTVKATPAEYEDDKRPNFFVAVRVVNDDTLDRLEDVATEIKLKDPSLKECCMGRPKYHLTLVTMKLDTPEEVNDAMVALSDLQMSQIEVPVIELKGVDIFRRRVLYACIDDENKQLQKLREQVIENLTQWKVNIMEGEVFVPHVTIVKTSRPASRLRGSRFIDPYLYINYADKLFGCETMNELYLCEMGDARSEDGFYKYATRVHLC